MRVMSDRCSILIVFEGGDCVGKISILEILWYFFFGWVVKALHYDRQLVFYLRKESVY